MNGMRKKTAANLRKHGVSFAEATSIFLDRSAITFPDPDHSDEEGREISIGASSKQRVLFVSHCERGNRIRIISARKATTKERSQYEEGSYEKSR